VEHEVLLIKEVAALLRCNNVHVRRLIESGKLRGVFDVRAFGKQHEYRIPRQSVVEFMSSSMNEAPKPAETTIEIPPPEAPRIFKPQQKNRVDLRGELAKFKRKNEG
jgi:excisionase family DNA binding protein